MPKVTIIIPAYNPAVPFVELVKGLVADFDVLVINDGSKEDCAPMFAEAVAAGAKLLVHEVNRGKGAALKTAISHLQSTGEEWFAVTADADGQHCIKDIKTVAKLTVDSPDSLVLGVRNFKGMPARSRFGNTMTRVSFYLATHTKISDTQTGLRGFTHLTADRLITAEGDRYEYEMNVLLGLKKWGIPVIETTIATIYIDGNASSHFHPIRDSLIVFGQVLKFTLASLLCTVLDYALYLSLITWTPIPPEWAYLGARAVSATINYQLSLKLVFHSKPDWRTTLAYYMLALSVVSTGSMLVMVFTNMGVNEAIIKIPVDVLLFFVNFFVQKHIIFK